MAEFDPFIKNTALLVSKFTQLCDSKLKGFCYFAKVRITAGRQVGKNNRNLRKE